jgi:hypothetical protein
MAYLKNRKIVLAPAQEYDFPMQGDFIRVTTANVPIYFKTRDGSVDFYLEAGEKADLGGVDFNSLIIYHLDGADQAVTISIGKDADISSAKLSGSVTVSSGTVTANIGNPAQAVGANTLATVTNANAQLLAANSTRKYLLIQNKDATGNIFINFGAVATVANGLRIAAGGSYELNCNVLTGVINAIGDIASNANIVIVQG